MVSRIGHAKIRNFLFLTAASLFGYINAVFLLAYPYRLFPSDDGYFLTHGAHWARINPVFFFLLDFFKMIGSVFEAPTLPLLFYGVMTSAAILVITALMIFRITKNYLITAVGVLVFATHPWPHTYLFFISYTTAATAFFMLSMLCCVSAFMGFHENRDFKKAVVRLAAGGFFSALYFLSSSSAALAIAVQAVSIFFLFSCVDFRRRAWCLGSFLFPLIFTGGLYLFFQHAQFFDHVFSNAYPNPHQMSALFKFGFIPRTPRLIFIRMLAVYSPALTAAFISLAVFWGLFIFKIKTCVPSPDLKVARFLFLFITGFIALMELLPFTRLGRSNFVIFPLIVVFGAIVLPGLFARVARLKRPLRNGVRAGLGVLLGFVVFQNVMFLKEMKNAKQSAFDAISRSCDRQSCAVLTDDPHASSIRVSLESAGGITIGEASGPVLAFLPKVHHGLILGPRGNNSGNSILKHGCFPDFHFEIPRFVRQACRVAYLPYYSYFPAFAFEEENSTGLFFLKMLPDYRLENSMITFIQCPGTAARSVAPVLLPESRVIFKMLYLNLIMIIGCVFAGFVWFFFRRG